MNWDILSDLNVNFLEITGGAVKVIAILIVAYGTVKFLNRIVRNSVAAHLSKILKETPDQLAARSKTLSMIITSALSIVIWVMAAIMILSELGVQVAPLLAGLGVASLTIGFAAQNIVRDYLHGFFIITEDWYRVGEVAVISGIGGGVVEISLRRTVLRDLDGVMHIIPNSKVELASNLTRDFARVNLNVRVAYKENLDQVISVINSTCQGIKEDNVWSKDILKTPKVERVDSLNDTGIDIKILGDTKPMRQWAVTGEIRKRLKERFDAEGIEIARPRAEVSFDDISLLRSMTDSPESSQRSSPQTNPQ